MIKKLVLYCAVAFSLISIFLKLHRTEKPALKWNCVKDITDGKPLCSLICPNESFALPGMTSCHPWLKCGARINLISTVFQSVVKTIYLASWEGHLVILSALASKQYKEDFKQNIMMLKALGPHPLVVQLLGFCDNFFLTQYHELGSALNAHYYTYSLISSQDNIKTRLSLCIDYASIINYLHNSPVGVRVMCDSNTLEKTLSQYLLTKDLKLIVNDLDATPLVSKMGVVCGPMELHGSFVAPEQLWPYPQDEYNSEKMPGYNEKTDIWKLPDVCNWFLGNSSEADVVKYKLFHIHKECKNINPSMRPSVDVILKTYETVFKDISNKMS